MCMIVIGTVQRGTHQRTRADMVETLHRQLAIGPYVVGNDQGPGGGMAAAHQHDDLFDHFARSRRRSLHLEAYRLCGDWHLAEDLVQVTLHKIQTRWHALDHHSQLDAYSKTTLRRTYLSERRKLRWSSEISLADVPDRAFVQGSMHMEDRMILFDALKDLGQRQREVVLFRYWQDLSVDETATILGCSASTVRSQSCRALAHLRSTLL